MREQYDQSRKKVSRNCLLLGALEVVLGVLVYFEIAELPSLPFTDSRLPEAVGFAAVYYGAYLLYWGGTLWQQAGDAEQWRQTDCVSGGPVSSYRTILTHSSVRFREIHRKHNFSGISEKNACNRHPSVIL